MILILQAHFILVAVHLMVHLMLAFTSIVIEDALCAQCYMKDITRYSLRITTPRTFYCEELFMFVVIVSLKINRVIHLLLNGAIGNVYGNITCGGEGVKLNCILQMPLTLHNLCSRQDDGLLHRASSREVARQNRRTIAWNMDYYKKRFPSDIHWLIVEEGADLPVKP